MEIIHKMKAGIIQTLGIFIVCLFMLMIIIGTYQIIIRYLFNKSSIVSEGLLTCSFTWMALLASAYMFGERDHMRIRLLTDKISGSVKKYLEVAISLPASTFAGMVMMYNGISITRLTVIQTTASLRVPMGHAYVAVLMTGITIMMFSLMSAVDMLHTDSSEKEDTRV